MTYFFEANTAAAMMLALILAGSIFVTRRPFLSAAVVASIGPLVPWSGQGFNGEAHAAFALACALLWVAWLYAERRPHLPNETIVATVVASVLALLLSSQSLFLVVLIGAYYALRPRGQRRPILAAAIVLIPLVVRFPLDAVCAKTHMTIFPPLLKVIHEAWSARLWYQSVHGYPFGAIDVVYNKWAYAWLLLALSAPLWSRRGEWWFWPTALWAGALAVSSFILGAAAYFQYNLVLQMALIVPLGIAAVGGASNRPGAAVTTGKGANCQPSSQ